MKLCIVNNYSFVLSTSKLSSLLISLRKDRISAMGEKSGKYSLILNVIRGLFVGLVSGLVIMVFANTIHFMTELNQRYFFLFLLLPVGAVLIYYLYTLLGNNFKKATVFAIDQIHEQEDRKESNLATAQRAESVNPLMGLVGYVASSISHLLGASVGKEGVGVQLGLSVGSMLDKLEDRFCALFHFKDVDSTAYYMMSGAAAAFGSLFGSPIAGALFGLQFASPDIIRLDAIIPCLISSFSATLVTIALGTHIMVIPEYEVLVFGISNLLYVSIFAVLIGLLVRVFCYSLAKFKELGAKCYGHLPRWVSSFVPALALMILMIILYFMKGDLRYNGLSTGLLYNSISGEMDWYAFIIKWILILLSAQAGFIGGEVVPLLVVGGTFGYSFASILSLPIPAFASLGALAMLAGGTNLPIVCFALGLELFHYDEPWLLFVACVISYVASGRNGIYDHQRRILV